MITSVEIFEKSDKLLSHRDQNGRWKWSLPVLNFGLSAATGVFGFYPVKSGT